MIEARIPNPSRHHLGHLGDAEMVINSSIEPATLSLNDQAFLDKIFE